MGRVVVFDMDDTLFPEREFVRSGFYAVDQFLLEEFGSSDFFSKAWALFDSGERGRIFNQALIDITEIECTEALIRKMVSVYREHLPSIRLFDDAKWALEYYSTKVPLALVSDGYLQTQKNKANALGVDGFFQKMYFTDQWGEGCWKPSTCAFLKVEESFNALKDKCIYISDNPKKDFIAPNQLGWDSIQIKRNTGEYANEIIPKDGHPKKIINSMYDLKDILSI